MASGILDTYITCDQDIRVFHSIAYYDNRVCRSVTYTPAAAQARQNPQIPTSHMSVSVENDIISINN